MHFGGLFYKEMGVGHSDHEMVTVMDLGKFLVLCDVNHKSCKSSKNDSEK